MILTCPNCGTQYVVKDGAIPPEGRQVRCAACKHSWHQESEAAAVPESAPETASAAGPAPIAEPASADEPHQAGDGESLAEATLIDPRSGPEAEERAFEEAVIDEKEEGTAVGEPAAAAFATGGAEAAPATAELSGPRQAETASDTFSPFAEYDEEPRRRGPLMTILIVALLIIVAAALFWFFAPPDLKARLGLVAAGASPLALVYTHTDRQQLESGNELLTVSGRVINPTTREQYVPPLQAKLTSKGGKVVYSWTIAPPARSLAAGTSASFNSAEVNVPPGGEYLTITLGQPKA